MNVAVLDFGAGNLRSLSRALEAGGAVVEVVRDPVEAVTRADAVITDQNMPRLDGLALTRALRADPRWQAMPVLILTTETGNELRDAGRKAGATGLLRKPFDPDRLLQVLGQVLARREN